MGGMLPAGGILGLLTPWMTWTWIPLSVLCRLVVLVGVAWIIGVYLAVIILGVAPMLVPIMEFLGVMLRVLARTHERVRVRAGVKYASSVPSS